MSKPLPTEPIRRVDLGFSHKPLDKTMRFHRGHECYIKKVPQAIVAPFRRNPPEKAISVTTPSVTPIHRASIATANMSSPAPAEPTATTAGNSRQAPIEEETVTEIEPATGENVKDKKEKDAGIIEKGASPAKKKEAVRADEEPNEDIPVPEGSPLPNTRSQQSPLRKSEAAPDVEPNNEPVSLKSESIQRMSKCQVEVRRLKENPDNYASIDATAKKEQSEKPDNIKPMADVQRSKSSRIREQELVREENSAIDRPKRSAACDKNPVNDEKPEPLEKQAKLEVKQKTSVDATKSTVEDPRKLADVPKVVLKKRKRKTNKTGFPTKIKKKKPRLEKPLEVQKDECLLEKETKHLSEKSAERSRRFEKKRFVQRDEPEPVKKSKSGRPLRIREVKVEESVSIRTSKRIVKSSVQSRDDSKLPSCQPEKISAQCNNVAMDKNENVDMVKDVKEANTQISKENVLRHELQTNLATNLKRTRENRSLTPVRSRKRLRSEHGSAEESLLNVSNTSSVDPSPASSDVESIDSRLNWDDESDQDSLSTLPTSEESFHCRSRKEKKKKKVGVRKTYLKSGLFSVDYKSLYQAQEGDQGTKLKGMVYKPEEHPFSLLPPPYYCGRQLRQKKEDYILPFDIWSLYSSNAIPTRDILATWNYKRIKNNIYYDVKPGTNYETPGCHCKQPRDPLAMGCMDDCINRMTYTECDPTCNLGERCSNTAIQKHQSTAAVERFMTRDKGWGIRAKTDIPSGTFIMEYLGEVVTDKEFKRRMHTDYKKDSHHYCLYLGEGMVIDGHRMGGECRFVNHSCKPNCEMQKWSVNGVYRMGLFNIRSLCEDEELTYDYNFSLFNPHEGQACHCHTSECRGVIGGKSQRVKVYPKLNSNSPKVANKADEKKKETRKPVKVVAKPFEKLDVSERRNNEEAEEEEEERKPSIPVLMPVKQMSSAQRDFCRSHCVLLPRNLEKIRKLRDKYLLQVNSHTHYKGSSLQSEPVFNTVSSSRDESANLEKNKLKSGNSSLTQTCSLVASNEADNQSEMRPKFVTTIRNLKEPHPPSSSDSEPSKQLELTKCFRDILSSLEKVKDKSGENIINFFPKLSSKEENSQYYLKISELLDLERVHESLESGLYSSVAAFDQDVLLVFQNLFRFFGQASLIGAAALTLRSEYLKLSTERFQQLTSKLGPNLTTFSKRPEPPAPEDEICCPCKQFKDEGVMIQCEACSVWLHLDCVHPGVDPETLGKFTCHRCSGTPPLLDIPLVPQPEYASPNEIYYVSLEREDKLHITLGTTVYVLRAFKEKPSTDNGSQPDADKSITTGLGGIPHKSISPIKGPSKEAATLASSNYPTYKTVNQDISTHDMDIFRIERLWKNETGAMFAFGYHYLRPHETFHEPTRRFYDNEVFRVPLYEVLPLDTIWRECWVMDPATFCKGRPLNAQESFLHICEYRVDKSARLFNKISKPKHGVCTKYFAFHNFDLRLRISRTYVVRQR